MRFIRSGGWAPVLAWAVVMAWLPACAGGPGAVAAGAVQSTPQRQSPRPQPPLTPEQIDNISFYTSILMDAATDVSIRARAAVRLRDMRVEQAVAPLVEALRSGEPLIQLAVVEAMSTAEPPVPALLEPGVAALRTASGRMRESLALSLARYDEPALRLLADIALDTHAPLEHRLNGIAALGAFRTRAAAIELMSMLDAAERESPEVVDAVCMALQRGTGLPYGAEPELWRRWWVDARDQPPEEWLTKMVQRLSEQIAASGQQVLHERERVQYMEQRVVDTYRELFHLVQPEEQMRLLPLLLEDQLASVRAFGMDRINRMLRDSVRPAEDVQHRLADRLNDDVPALRLQAARLLDQLNYEPVAERLANRLAAETSPEVAAGLLDILARRPSRAALEHVLPWLADRAQADRAANVAWEIVALGELTDEQTIASREAARAAMARWATPPCARLLVVLADEAELPGLQALLDSDSPHMRRHVAEGFFRRGARQPLLDRAGDDIIYPYLVRLIARGPADLTNLQLLGSLLPVEPNRQVWHDAVVRLHTKLPVERLIEADDLLQLWSDSTALRLETLARGAALSPDALPPEQRAEVIVRLARLHLAFDEPQRAHELIETANGLATMAGISEVRFEAAALAGHFSIAAQVQPEPGPWIELLRASAERNAGRAIALQEEITRRFADQLNGEHKAELDAMRERLRRIEPRDEAATS